MAELFRDSPPSVRQAIASFQEYIISENVNRSPRWRHAQRLIQNVAGALLATFPEPYPPVEPEVVAKLFRITILATGSGRFNGDGHLIPRRDGFDLLLGEKVASREVSHIRRRFTIAHECGHVVFFTEDRGTLQPIIPRELRTSWREEGLCHAFARALLIPEEAVGSFAECEPTVSTLFTVAGYLRVSIEGVLRRLLHDLGYWPRAVFYRATVINHQPRVDCFRGTDCKKSGSVLTGPRVAARLEGVTDAHQIVRRLTDTWSLTRANIGYSGYDVWFRL